MRQCVFMQKGMSGIKHFSDGSNMFVYPTFHNAAIFCEMFSKATNGPFQNYTCETCSSTLHKYHLCFSIRIFGIQTTLASPLERVIYRLCLNWKYTMIILICKKVSGHLNRLATLLPIFYGFPLWIRNLHV